MCDNNFQSTNEICNKNIQLKIDHKCHNMRINTAMSTNITHILYVILCIIIFVYDDRLKVLIILRGREVDGLCESIQNKEHHIDHIAGKERECMGGHTAKGQGYTLHDVD